MKQARSFRPQTVDPASALPLAQLTAIRAVIAACSTMQGPLLPVLHGVQDALGYVPPSAIPLIAAELNLSRAEVHGVVSFYHHFRSAPPGRHVVQLCRAEACQAAGAVELERHAKARLGVDFGGTTADGRYTLLPVYCLGNCACGPSLMIDEELRGRVDAEAFDALLAGEGGA